MSRSALLPRTSPVPAAGSRVAARGLVVVGCAVALLAPALPAQASSSPTVTSVSPAVTHAGRTVTVTGTGLEDANGVTVDGKAAVLTTIKPAGDGSSLTFTVPTDAVGTSPVTVTTASGGTATSPGSLEVDAPPAAVTGLSASLGAHGLVLHWTGQGTGATRVRHGVDGAAAPTWAYGGCGVPLTGSSTAYDQTFTNTAPRSYAVFAMASDGTPSAPATLTVAPRSALATTLTLAAAPTTVLPGRSSTLSGRLTRTTGGLALGGSRVTLYRRVLGTSTYSAVRTLATASDGTVRTSVTASRTVAYSLYFAGDAFSRPSSSSARVVRLQPQISASFSDPSVLLTQSSTLRGTVTPAYGAATVLVQRYSGGAWRNVRYLQTSSTGTWSMTVTAGVGRYLYRAVLLPATTYLRATSPSRLLQVSPRSLVQGNQGGDVLALERALAGLHYFTGPQDGYFDSRLTHAVIAFEKVERLSRNGTWGSAERARLVAPRGFALRYPSAGRAAEVDITRQVLVLSQGGAIVKIVDVSTGSGNHYTQDGVDNVAHTPRGRFHITHKIDGIRVSKLGELYRPSYFFEGYAVHGNGSVPTYPASHGCVRVTNPVADYLFPLLTVGTPLAVYDE